MVLVHPSKGSNIKRLAHNQERVDNKHATRVPLATTFGVL